MRISIKTLIVVLLTVMSFAAAQTVHADEVPLSGTVYSGTVSWVNPGGSEIWIIDEDGETVTIIGFPFHNLEVQLEEELGETITIDEEDCVTITYYEKYDEVNKWLSLTMYCEACSGCNFDNDDDQWHCDDGGSDIDSCFEDEDGMTRKPQRTSRPDPPAGPWNGKPPGFRHRP